MNTRKKCVIELALIMFVIVLFSICANEKAYADDKVEYTVRYVDEDNKEISNPCIEYAYLHEQVCVIAKEIDGYIARQNEQKIILDKDNMEITFNYVKEKTVVVEDNIPKRDNKNNFDLIKEDTVVYDVEDNNRIRVSRKTNDKVVTTDTKKSINPKRNVTVSSSKGKTNGSNSKKKNIEKTVTTSKPVKNKVKKDKVIPIGDTVDVDDNEQEIPNYMKPYVNEDLGQEDIEYKNENSSSKIVIVIICLLGVLSLVIGSIWTIKNRREIFK